VSSSGVFLGPSTNNVAEYNAVIKFLRDAILHGIHSLEVFLESQLVVCQLNDSYCVRYPTYFDDSYEYEFWNDILILLLIITFLEVIIMYPMHMLILFYIGICHINKERKNFHQCTHCNKSKAEDQCFYIYFISPKNMVL
jgi:hypothetical protein